MARRDVMVFRLLFTRSNNSRRKGTRNTIVSVPEQPSGLGWDKQGELLIVSMRSKIASGTVMAAS